MEKLNSQARITELGDVANRLVELFKRTTALQEDSFLSDTFGEMEKQAKEMTDAIKRDSVRSELEEADERRDDAIRVLAKLLSGYEFIPVDSLRPHGVKLAAIFKKYGVKIIEENYSSQSNLIDSMLLDFSTSDALESIAALTGVTEAIANLRKEQTAFAKIRAEYEKALAQKETLASATALRRPLLDTINKKAITYLSTMQMVNPDKFSNFNANASKIIGSVNEVVKARSSKKEKSENNSVE